MRHICKELRLRPARNLRQNFCVFKVRSPYITSYTKIPFSHTFCNIIEFPYRFYNTVPHIKHKKKYYGKQNAKDIISKGVKILYLLVVVFFKGFYKGFNLREISTD